MDVIISCRGHRQMRTLLAVSHCYRVAFVKEEGQWQCYAVYCSCSGSLTGQTVGSLLEVGYYGVT